MKTILVPVDLSKPSARVCNVACDLAHWVKGRLVLLHVVRPPFADFAEFYAIGMIGSGSIDAILAAGERAADRRLEQLVRRCRQRGVATRRLLRTETVVPAILEQVRATRASYVVMGSHGHGGVYDLLLGSTTSGVLRKTRCPIVVVPIRPRSRRK